MVELCLENRTARKGRLLLRLTALIYSHMARGFNREPLSDASDLISPVLASFAFSLSPCRTISRLRTDRPADEIDHGEKTNSQICVASHVILQDATTVQYATSGVFRTVPSRTFPSLPFRPSAFVNLSTNYQRSGLSVSRTLRF